MSNVQEIIEKQQSFAKMGLAKDVSFRKKQLQLLKKVLKENETLLYQAIFDDVKKSSTETYITELAVIYHEIDHSIKHLDKWSKPVKVKTSLTNIPGKSFIIPEPFGTTLIIGAWNYPYQLVLMPTVTALAAGNTAILKPSELSGSTSAALKNIINNHFDSGYLHVIEGGIEITTELLTHPFGKICFTGSTAVGKIIAKAAAETLTPTILELGGKSPCFVFPGVDIKIAAKRIAWGKFLNAGQTCIAPDYLYVHTTIYDEFLEELKKQTQLITGDNPLESESYIRIINSRHFQRLNKLINTEKVFSGGTTNASENYIEPTILKDVTWDDACMKQEIFGPILPVMRFDKISDAISKVKDEPNPLALYIFSKNKQHHSKIVNELSFGGGCINDAVMHFSNKYLPFGGVGSSGMGNYHGEHGFKAFSHQKAMYKRHLWIEPNIKYAPYTKFKFNILRYLFGQK